MKKSYSLIPVLLLNTIPIVGVLCFGWNVYQLIFIFWIESLLVGVFNLFKMAMARKSQRESPAGKVFSKLGYMLFFCFHYFFFLWFIIIFASGNAIDFSKMDMANFNLRLITLTLIGGCISGFIIDYILPRKYLTTAPSDLFFAPYARVWILATLIFAGGFISHKGMGNEYFYLVVMVATKLVTDVISFFVIARKEFLPQN